MKEMLLSLLRGYESKLIGGKLLDIKHIQDEELWRKQRGKDFVRRTTLACVLAATFNVYTALSLLSCFFPLYAEKNLNASKMTIGIIFAAHPVAEIFFCPVASMMCKKMGRFAVFNFGLTLVAIGIFFFGFAQTIPQFMFARLLEGVGSTCVQVSGIALIIEHTNNLVRDIGFQEMMSGIGYSVGPLIGGVLYTMVGMKALYIIVSFIPLIIMAAFHISRVCVATKSKINPTGESLELQHLLKLPVLASCIAIVITAASYGFLDTTLSEHLYHVAGLDPAGSGLVYILPPITYAFFSVFAGRIINRYGNKQTIIAGLVFSSIGYILIGPIPLLPIKLGEQGMWVLLISCLVLMGVGEALILIPAIPLMLSILERRSEKEKGQKKDDINDAIAGLFSFSWSSGDFIGPLLGGFLTEYAPKTMEYPCTVPEGDCLSGFPSAAAIFGMIGLLVLVLVALGIPKRMPKAYPDEDQDVELHHLLPGA